MTDSEKLDLILSEVQSIKSTTQELEKKVSVVEKKVSVVENKVTDINLILENEIRVNIQRVAEGHLDLSRNMHEVMKPNNEIEMLAIKVRMLETDVRELKARLA